MNNSEFQARAEELDRLVERVSALADSEARTAALELLQSSMDLHGAALSRMVEVLSQSGEAGRNLLAKLGSDPLICGLLVLYGIHPVSLEDRINRSLEKLGPQLRKQNAAVELVSINEGVVRIRITGASHGCGSSPDTLKSIAQQTILEAAPEVVEIIVEGLPSSTSGFVPLNTIQSANKEEGKYEESTAQH
jgi:Fe-S cluster biogenesis protein NfuA